MVRIKWIGLKKHKQLYEKVWWLWVLLIFEKIANEDQIFCMEEMLKNYGAVTFIISEDLSIKGNMYM